MTVRCYGPEARLFQALEAAGQEATLDVHEGTLARLSDVADGTFKLADVEPVR